MKDKHKQIAFDFLATLMFEQEERRRNFTGTDEEFWNSPTELIICQTYRQLGAKCTDVPTS